MTHVSSWLERFAKVARGIDVVTSPRAAGPKRRRRVPVGEGGAEQSPSLLRRLSLELPPERVLALGDIPPVSLWIDKRTGHAGL